MQEDLLNQVKLNFSPESLIVLNLILGFVMFGVALELKAQHFKELIKAPKTYLIGLSSQFIEYVSNFSFFPGDHLPPA